MDNEQETDRFDVRDAVSVSSTGTAFLRASFFFKFLKTRLKSAGTLVATAA